MVNPLKFKEDSSLIFLNKGFSITSNGRQHTQNSLKAKTVSNFNEKYSSPNKSNDEALYLPDIHSFIF
jgi:hypothetical protein